MGNWPRLLAHRKKTADMKTLPASRTAVLVAALSVCASHAAEPPRQPIKITAPHLPNAYQVHAQVISGGLPEGDAAFQELADRVTASWERVNKACADCHRDYRDVPLAQKSK